MSTTIESRCTQCRTVNTNSVPSEQTKHGDGSAHGVEVVLCDECSGSCDLDECFEGDPCERCHTETVQNRCGSSVPVAQS